MRPHFGNRTPECPTCSLLWKKAKVGLWHSHFQSEPMQFLCCGTKPMHVDSTQCSPPISSRVFNVYVVPGQKTGLGLVRIAWRKSRTGIRFFRRRIVLEFESSILLLVGDLFLFFKKMVCFFSFFFFRNSSHKSSGSSIYMLVCCCFFFFCLVLFFTKSRCFQAD